MERESCVLTRHWMNTTESWIRIIIYCAAAPQPNRSTSTFTHSCWDIEWKRQRACCDSKWWAHALFVLTLTRHTNMDPCSTYQKLPRAFHTKQRIEAWLRSSFHNYVQYWNNRIDFRSSFNNMSIDHEQLCVKLHICVLTKKSWN